jgi:hypothetical protein
MSALRRRVQRVETLAGIRKRSTSFTVEVNVGAMSEEKIDRAITEHCTRTGYEGGDVMTRCLLPLLCLWSTVWLSPAPLAQGISPDVQPAPLVRLTGAVETAAVWRPVAWPSLRLWVGEKVWLFHLSAVEPVLPAYRASEQVRKVSGQGLRLLIGGQALAQLEQAVAQQRLVTLEGWLRPRAGVLRVSAVHVGQDGR